MKRQTQDIGQCSYEMGCSYSNFLPTPGNTYTLEFSLHKACFAIAVNNFFEVDDVFISYVEEQVVEKMNYSVSNQYRYSFQNQEKHDEIRGKGNYINNRYRGYDPRVGRLDWAVDPLAPEYPYNSPYAFSENVVISHVELEGLEKEPANLQNTSHYGKTRFYVFRAIDFKNRLPKSTVPSYYLNYGYKYAKKFNGEIYDAMKSIGNERGMAFVKNATVNLQKAIEDKLETDPDIESDDAAFTAFAFSSHVDAYVDAGFLEIGVVGQAIVSLAVDPEDLFSEAGIKQAAGMLEKLKEYHENNPGSAAKMVADIIMNYKNLTQMATKYYNDNKDYFKESNIDFQSIMDRLTHSSNDGDSSTNTEKE